VVGLFGEWAVFDVVAKHKGAEPKRLAIATDPRSWGRPRKGTSSAGVCASRIYGVDAAITEVEAFQASDNPLDEDFVRDLERVMARTRGELVAFATRKTKASY
jgi:hypothetical protein